MPFGYTDSEWAKLGVKNLDELQAKLKSERNIRDKIVVKEENIISEITEVATPVIVEEVVIEEKPKKTTRGGKKK